MTLLDQGTTPLDLPTPSLVIDRGSVPSSRSIVTIMPVEVVLP